mgnify:CR=1 FL=1
MTDIIDTAEDYLHRKERIHLLERPAAQYRRDDHGTPD